MLIGKMANVELLPDNEDGGTIAYCREHPDFWAKRSGLGECVWEERFDTMNDATEYAADHADFGRA